jgi:hypothetical protein
MASSNPSAAMASLRAMMTRLLPPRLHRRLDLQHGLIERNDLLAGKVTALLGDDSVFDLHCGGAGALKFLDGPMEIQGAA